MLDHASLTRAPQDAAAHFGAIDVLEDSPVGTVSSTVPTETDPVPQIGNVNAAVAALRNWAVNLHNELAGTGIQAAHVAIDVAIGNSDAAALGLPTAPAEQISPVYWELHTNRDDPERIFSA